MRSLLVIAILVAGGCGTTPPPPAAASQTSTPSPGTGELHLLLTTDEHGWLSPLVDAETGQQRGGIVAAWDMLTRVEGYAPTAARRAQGFLLVSTGDMWTGPYESTLLEGAPMVESMNYMGYAAASLGNHEFDFGVRVLGEHSARARFPLLAANLVEDASGELPSWARPFTIVEVGGLKLGVVGLTNVETPITSDPRHLTGLSFLPYAEAIEKWVPRARAAGADEVIVLIHDELALADQLMPVLRKHRVRAASFGHHHRAGTRIDDAGTPELDDDVTVCNAGAYLRSYCRIDLGFAAGKLTSRSVRVAEVKLGAGERPAQRDPTLVGIVQRAEEHAQQIGGEVLVESKRALRRGSQEAMGQLLVDSWLAALPYAQVAITNAGGIRQDLPAGPVRVRDIVSVLPFNNFLLVVELTGAELKEVLTNDASVVGGVRYRFSDAGGTRKVVAVTLADGTPVTDDAKLRVVINDFMYRGGDRFTFARYDDEPEETAIDWREPVLRWLRALGRRHQALDLVADDRARSE